MTIEPSKTSAEIASMVKLRAIDIVPTEVRVFSNETIQKAVNDALATIPEGKKGAVLAVADLEGARLVAAARLSSGWSIVGILDKPWNGKLNALAEVRFEW